jgi:hypothetical protein
MPKKDQNGKWINGSGNPVDPKLIQPLKKKRTYIVEKHMKTARRLSNQIAKFKRKVLADIEAFQETAFHTYDVSVGGQKGNVTLSTYAHDMKIERQANPHNVITDITPIKILIDECIAEWGKESPVDFVTIVNELFKPDSQGRLSLKSLLTKQAKPFLQKCVSVFITGESPGIAIGCMFPLISIL